MKLSLFLEDVSKLFITLKTSKMSKSVAVILLNVNTKIKSAAKVPLCSIQCHVDNKKIH